MTGNIFIYLASFFILWVGAGLIVSSVDRFSRKLKASSFAVSFFILGLATSIPEFSVGMTAVAEKKPDVFVGNLIGGIPIIFFLIIPILAILGNGVKLKNQLSSVNLFISFIVILIPTFFVLDGLVTNFEAIIMIASYGILFLLIQLHHGFFDSSNGKIFNVKSYSLVDFIKIVAGVGMAFISSQIIVDNTLYFASMFQVSAFYISLLFLSLGTNLPEFSLAIRSVMSGKKDVAFGDYVGSAAANTLLFGIFTLITVGDVKIANGFHHIFILMAIGLAVFFLFAKSKYEISRKEGLMLLILYAAFIAVEQFPQLLPF